MQHFTSVNDVADINSMIEKALFYKSNSLADITLGAHKKIGLLFFNPSLRTRISTQVAAQNLGMDTVVFNVDKDSWALEFNEGVLMNGSTVEHIKDAAPVMGQYFDILCVRSFPGLHSKVDDYAETVISQFIKYTGLPIVSLESGTLHPLQSLTDLITIKENMAANTVQAVEGFKPKIVLAWAPHIKPLPQCVPNSFSQWVNAWGESDFVIAHPEGYALDEWFTKGAAITHHLDEALANADYVYVKNWSAYKDYGSMPAVNGEWMLTNEMLAKTNNAKVMHCLPVRRNVELSDEVLDGPNSLVTQQAGNRVWAAQAVFSKLLEGNIG